MCMVSKQAQPHQVSNKQKNDQASNEHTQLFNTLTFVYSLVEVAPQNCIQNAVQISLKNESTAATAAAKHR